jgi:hypothetical protein
MGWNPSAAYLTGRSAETPRRLSRLVLQLRWRAQARPTKVLKIHPASREILWNRAASDPSAGIGRLRRLWSITCLMSTNAQIAAN